MPQTRECDYCESDIEPGTGTMFVAKNGAVTYYCSSKCEKNSDLGREPRDLEWTSTGQDADVEDEAETEDESIEEPEPEAEESADEEAEESTEEEAEESTEDEEADSDAEDDEAEEAADAEDETEDEEEVQA